MDGGAMPPELKASFFGLGAWKLKEDRVRGMNYPIKPIRKLGFMQTPKEDIGEGHPDHTPESFQALGRDKETPFETNIAPGESRRSICIRRERDLHNWYTFECRYLVKLVL
jgi:hypothetical protein